MRYYSRNGDQGISNLITGRNIPKSDPIFDLLGSIDELSAFIGLAISSISDENIQANLRTIQIIFSRIMTGISGGNHDFGHEIHIQESLEWLEDCIESIGAQINPPTGFIFPGKNDIGSRLDVCRTIARRVERVAIRVYEQQGAVPQFKEFIPFLNRVSTYFFVLRLMVEKSEEN